MRFLASTIKGLPVVTQSGKKLGKVVDLEFDINSWSLINIRAHSFAKEQLIIAASQIIKIETDKVTVEDGVLTESDAVKLKVSVSSLVSPGLNTLTD